MSKPQDSDYVELKSAHNFPLTVERIGNAVEKAGMMILAQVDHSAGARQFEMTLPPTMVIFYGHPRNGTPIMLAEPRTALELPLRVLVREAEDGKVLVAFHPIAAALRRDGATAEVAAQLEPAQKLIVDAIK